MSVNFENAEKACVTIGGVQKIVDAVYKVVNGTFVKIYEGILSEIKVVFNANGGLFASNNTETNTIIYSAPVFTEEEITKISKTSNVSEDGSSFSGDYGNSQSLIDVITIPDATELEITITYQTESTSYDWVCIYDNSITPSRSNYSSSISGKLGGKTKTTKTFTIPGDTVQFYFTSDSSVSSYYGYYAIVTGISKVSEMPILSGQYEEPTINTSDLIFKNWYKNKDCTPDSLFNLDTDLVNLKRNTILYAGWVDPVEAALIDFDFIRNEDGTFTLTEWKGTTNGIKGTEIIIPDEAKIIL